MTVRTEIESRLLAYAQAEMLPVAFENASFEPPAGDWLSLYFLSPSLLNRNLAAEGVREEGMFQVSIFTKQGTGTGRSNELVRQVSALFPVLPKDGLVSIESPPTPAKGFPDGSHWCVPVTVRYRAEI